MLACNCYVLAPRAGADAIVVDPGQRAMGRAADPGPEPPDAGGGAVTHGHIDHVWSAQKVADMYGCPAYIHPEDRFMLTDPNQDFGPAGIGKLAQLAFGELFSEPRQVIELDSDGDRLGIGGMVVTVDHTPGHTRGSVVFRVTAETSDVVFTGDTLFRQSMGPPTCPAAAAGTCWARS